jgi:hypothetical protein
VKSNSSGQGSRHFGGCPPGHASADYMARRGSFAFWANLPDPLTDKLFEASRRILPIRNRGAAEIPSLVEISRCLPSPHERPSKVSDTIWMAVPLALLRRGRRGRAVAHISASPVEYTPVGSLWPTLAC